MTSVANYSERVRTLEYLLKSYGSRHSLRYLKSEPSRKEPFYIDSSESTKRRLRREIDSKEKIFSEAYGSLYQINLSRENIFKNEEIKNPFDTFEPPRSCKKDIDFSKSLKTPSCNFEGARLPELLQEIKSQRDPRKFKEAILRGIQLYFDGLVERGGLPDPEAWAEQLEALNAMLRGAGMTVAAFYRQNQEIPFDEVRGVVLPHDSRLIKYGSKSGCKNRHLAGDEHHVGSYAVSVARALEGEKVDLVIPVASGGFEPAVLTADYLGVNNLFPIRFSRVSRSDSEVLVPTCAPRAHPMQQISGRRVLIVDDIVASGVTASRLAQWIKNYDPERVYFAVVKSEGKNLDNFGFHKHQSSQHLYRHSREAVLV